MTETQGTIPAVQAYLQALMQGLSPLPAAEREDVLREIRAHLEDGVAAGESPADLIDRLGPAGVVAGAMVEERLVTVDRRRSTGELAKVVFKAAWRPFWVAMITILAIMESNTLFLYQGWIAEHHIAWSTMLRLLVLSLPAIIVATVPVATLYVGLCGIPKLAGEFSRPLFRHLMPKLALAVLGFGVVASGLSFILNDTLVIAGNRATVDLQRSILKSTPSESMFFAPRSPQEQTMRELGRSILDRKRGPGNGVNDAMLLFDYNMKVAMPVAALVTSTLGLALGLAFARRRPIPLLAQVIVGIAAVMGWYTLYSLARGMGPGLGWPILAAWLPNLITVAVAGVIGATATLLKREPLADV